MLGKKTLEPKLMYNVTLSELVPEDNYYRVIEEILDLRFVYQECKSLYGKTGNPSIDPVVFFKINLFGFLEGITSDRQLVKEASDRISVRYFLGYDFNEQLPWHSTISRTRGIIKEELFEKVFNKILEQCFEAGLIDGKHQTIDSTLVKANASLESLERKEPKLTLEEFIEKSYEENKIEDNKKGKTDNSEKNDANKNNEELKLIKNKANRKIKQSKGTNKKYYSKTDSDSRVAKKRGKPSRLCYKTHYSSDSKKRVITGVLTTFADRGDSEDLMNIYNEAERRLKKLGLPIEEISADKGYSSGKSLRELEQKGVKAFIPTSNYKSENKKIAGKEFQYIEEENLYVCPNQKKLKHIAYDKKEQRNRYYAKEEDCNKCPFKAECCPEAKKKGISKTIYYKEFDRLLERLKTPESKRAGVIRKTVAEGLFAEAKMYHGLEKFMTRGIEKANKTSYMIATVQNLKRLVEEKKRKTKITIQNKNRQLFESIFEHIFDSTKFILEH